VWKLGLNLLSSQTKPTAQDIGDWL